jgi:transposase
MPKHIQARLATDAAEEGIVRKLAASRHGPADVLRRAQMIVKSWEGKNTKTIADELNCHPKTVRVRVARFNALGIEGLQDAPGRGRKARLTERERSIIVGLIGQTPPGQLVRERDGELYVADEQGEAHWSLDALAHAAQRRGIRVERSQIRRIFLHEGIPWRRTHSWAESTDPDFVPKGQRSSRSTLNRR